MIYEEVEQIFPNANVDLYYNEANSEHLALTVKFAADIDPSESSKYCEEVNKGFMNLFMNSFICDFFEICFSRKLFSRKPLWGITKHLSAYKTYKDYSGFVYYL